jgi:putative FmdB family regulatory protein
MPIYTYRCENCGIQFDRRQHFEDKALIKCPECGKESLRKVYLPVGIVFKGSGFYATDHRSPSGKGSTKKSEKKSETKAENNSNEKKSSKED